MDRGSIQVPPLEHLSEYLSFQLAKSKRTQVAEYMPPPKVLIVQKGGRIRDWEAWMCVSGL